MNSLDKMDNPSIQFFKPGKKINHLRWLLSYLAQRGESRPYRFSFAGPNHELIDHLTIRENLELSCVDLELIHKNEQEIEKKIFRLKNPHLFDFFQIVIPQLEKPFAELAKREKKITSLLRALVQNSRFIFLDRPEIDLYLTDLQLLARVLNHKSARMQREIIIITNATNIWPDAQYAQSVDEFKPHYTSRNNNHTSVIPIKKLT